MYTGLDMSNDLILQIAIVLVVVLFSMTIHEAMHAFTSYWLGDDTAKHSGRLTLNPIAHIDPFLTLLLPVILAVMGLPIFGGAKPVPFNPSRVRYGDFGAALVGLAGPFTNFFIAFIAFGLYALIGAPQTGGAAMIFQYVVMVNLGFFVFNMIPVPPLDGSRLLYALAPEGARRVMETIERNGLILIFAVVLLFSGQIGQFILAAMNAIVTGFSRLFGVQ